MQPNRKVCSHSPFKLESPAIDANSPDFYTHIEWSTALFCVSSSIIWFFVSLCCVQKDSVCDQDLLYILSNIQKCNLLAIAKCMRKVQGTLSPSQCWTAAILVLYFTCKFLIGWIMIALVIKKDFLFAKSQGPKSYFR